VRREIAYLHVFDHALMESVKKDSFASWNVLQAVFRCFSKEAKRGSWASMATV
jgi:quinol-cytochrome oxidoreductase complex cytochrome b subunit